MIFCGCLHFSTTESTDRDAIFSPGLLKMLSFGFQKLKIFLLLKTLERFVTDCHLNLILYIIATCLGIYDCFFYYYYFLLIVNLGSPSVREVVSCLGLSVQY